MNISAAMSLRSEGRQIAAGSMNARFVPVHAGAHTHFTKIGYIHTGNKMRGGIGTSEYFKRKNGNSRTVSVQADGSYVKMSRTPSGMRRSRGKLDAKGMKCHNVSQDMSPENKNQATVGAADAAKPNHMVEYQRMMKESAAHQRAADALAQSHNDEDRPLYEHHAGKAWRIGNKAMEHFRRLTKEQRAMLRDQHWQTYKPQPPGNFGRGKKMQSSARLSLAEPENIIKMLRTYSPSKF